MKLLRAMTASSHGPIVEWSASATIFALALGLRFEALGLLPPGYPFVTFVPAVFLTGFFVSTRAGIVMALACGLAAAFFFVAPVQSLRLGGAGLAAMAFYAVIVGTELLVIAAMRAALRKLEQERADWARQAQSNTLMFHELQHRVSNNLQVIGSILRMEERKARDPGARKALNSAAARLGVIASLQRQLHDPRRQVTEIGTLMQNALPEIVAAANLSGRVHLDFDLVPLPVPADQATPVALIIVEMVSNALEHALGAAGRLTITLRTRLEDGIARVMIEDDGTGLPADFDPQEPASLGLRLARQFATQLEGHLEFGARAGGGTVVALSFPPAPTDPASE